jgi:hypothetical protein
MYHSPGLRDGVFVRVRVCGPAFPKSLEQNQYVLGLSRQGINSGAPRSVSSGGARTLFECNSMKMKRTFLDLGSVD